MAGCFLAYSGVTNLPVFAERLSIGFFDAAIAFLASVPNQIWGVSRPLS
jgi:hypothetical protein